MTLASSHNLSTLWSQTLDRPPDGTLPPTRPRILHLAGLITVLRGYGSDHVIRPSFAADLPRLFSLISPQPTSSLHPHPRRHCGELGTSDQPCPLCHFRPRLRWGSINTMPAYHSVLIQFKGDATEENKLGTWLGFKAQLEDCHHPALNGPYISSVLIGNNPAMDQVMEGYTYIFTLQFKYENDRKWYVNGDPIAKRFMRQIEHLIEKVETVDFECETEGQLVSSEGSSQDASAVVLDQQPAPENQGAEEEQ
ncbi:hypothetical protein QBC43DRAFT_323964 [Cladorrhinum sp. PSN259]|nr:hypothetical protein QBC43DRAFT_323964 [Cladorrhinum sp. PSN259]